MTQLLVDDLLVYNGSIKMASGSPAVSCHTVVFTDSTEQELTTAIMYISHYHYYVIYM